MALFPSVIPWTLVLTQVMTAGLAVVPGRWAHLFRKCLQVQVLCRWERAGGDPRGLGYISPFGSGSLEKKEKKKTKKNLPFALHKKRRRRAKMFTIGGQRTPSSLLLLLARVHSWTFSAKMCTEGQSRSILVLLQKLPHRKPWSSSQPQRRRHIVHRYENTFSWASVLWVFVHIWPLHVIAQASHS